MISHACIVIERKWSFVKRDNPANSAYDNRHSSNLAPILRCTSCVSDKIVWTVSLPKANNNIKSHERPSNVSAANYLLYINI